MLIYNENQNSRWKALLLKTSFKDLLLAGWTIFYLALQKHWIVNARYDILGAILWIGPTFEMQIQ